LLSGLDRAHNMGTIGEKLVLRPWGHVGQRREGNI
jgi:hypothetical protein